MGLFSFLKNSGKKVKPAPAPDPAVTKRQTLQALYDEVQSIGVEVDELNIDLEDDKVRVSGQCTSQADRDKVVLALGNIEGIATVYDSIEIEEEEAEATFYEVKSGDSLSKIAKAHYGDAMKYNVIFEANQPMLKDPNLIYPGQVLRIPPLED